MKKLKWPGWERRHLWPEVDPPGYLFLGRAFDVVGEAMFSDWTGYEIEDAEIDVVRRIPSASEAYREGQPHYGFHKEYGPLVIEQAGKGHPDPGEPISYELWRAVADWNNAQFDKARFATARRDAVVKAMADLAICGDLVFASRPLGGGVQPTLIDRECWTIDYPWVPFATLGWDESQGLSSVRPTHRLFVTTESLESVIKGRATRPAPQQVPLPEPAAASPDRPSLPPCATPANRKHEAAAHRVAELVREKRWPVAAALRKCRDLVAPDGRTDDSIERAIRNSYDLMYDRFGTVKK